MTTSSSGTGSSDQRSPDAQGKIEKQPCHFRENISGILGRFESLSPCDRRSLASSSLPEEVMGLEAFRRLLRTEDGANHALWKHRKGWARIALLLPLAGHSESGFPNIGKFLSAGDLSGKRLRLICSPLAPSGSEAVSSEDIGYLRRAFRMCNSRGITKLNWITAGAALFYWGTRSKEDILRDFFFTN